MDLRGEVPVQSAERDVGPLGNLTHLYGVEPALGRKLGGGPKDAMTPGALRLGGKRVVTVPGEVDDLPRPGRTCHSASSPPRSRPASPTGSRPCRRATAEPRQRRQRRAAPCNPPTTCGSAR